MKSVSILVFLMIFISLNACKETPEKASVEEEVETTKAEDAPDYAAFDSKVATIRAFAAAHGAENLEKLSELLSDTLKWSPPQYNGGKWLTKADLLSALKDYHANFDNIQFMEGIELPDTTAGGMWSGSVYPQASASVNPDAIRVYGTWKATHTASKKEIGVKWFGLYWMNEDGKIAMVTDYYDVNGIAKQISEK
ncbi:MAG: nuclear transport factor 2 family protein [Altibacter sp.]|uniref:nuclear transport factor 2 family protein n=1 Tax=Altibacter sp. TaxID=2024823 RepID=UPI001D3B6869|nr:nuclear transport factor 2 family protein [Altibacter sp.]MBZ0328196.1 nuclear transport factor 2 family protein [Altibacter sp.]